VAVRVGELNAAIQVELERQVMDLDTRLDLDPFVGLVGAALAELAIADDIDTDLIDFQPSQACRRAPCTMYMVKVAITSLVGGALW